MYYGLYIDEYGSSHDYFNVDYTNTRQYITHAKGCEIGGYLMQKSILVDAGSSFPYLLMSVDLVTNIKNNVPLNPYSFKDTRKQKNANKKNNKCLKLKMRTQSSLLTRG